MRTRDVTLRSRGPQKMELPFRANWGEDVTDVWSYLLHAYCNNIEAETIYSAIRIKHQRYWESIHDQMHAFQGGTHLCFARKLWRESAQRTCTLDSTFIEIPSISSYFRFNRNLGISPTKLDHWKWAAPLKISIKLMALFRNSDATLSGS